MAVLMENDVTQGSTEIYDAVAEKLEIEGNPPAGMIAHAAIDRGEGGMRIVDVWESQQDFETFRDERLFPAIQSVMQEKGVEMEGPPSYEFSEIHHFVKP
jgi:heme-degrading monooxygenase HmoA